MVPGLAPDMGPDMGTKLQKRAMPNHFLTVAPDTLDYAIEAMQDTSLDIADRVVIYAGLRRLKLHIERALRDPKDAPGLAEEIIRIMRDNDQKEWAGLELKERALDVAFPCNAEENWGDSLTQDTLADWRKESGARPFIREIPWHLEIATAALGRAVKERDPWAIDLWQRLNDKGFRTQGVKVPTLAVRDD
jgi:hypothetical protein